MCLCVDRVIGGVESGEGVCRASQHTSSLTLSDGSWASVVCGRVRESLAVETGEPRGVDSRGRLLPIILYGVGGRRPQQSERHERDKSLAGSLVLRIVGGTVGGTGVTSTAQRLGWVGWLVSSLGLMDLLSRLVRRALVEQKAKSIFGSQRAVMQLG